MFKKEDGWQFAPTHMIYDIKQQDLRHKARLVMGGNVIDSSQHTTYSSTIQNLSVRLLMIISIQNNLDLMAADIGNAFPTAPCAKKIWTKCGAEFGPRRGAVAVVKRALYGLKTASRSFHEFLGDTLRSLGFRSSRADQDLWYRESKDYEGYDYIASHVDDLLIASKRPQEIMAAIEHEFMLRNKEDSPSYYLGNDLRRTKEGYLHVSSKKYVTEVLRRYQDKYGSVKKENIPMSKDAHPEMDDSPLLTHPDDISHFQHIIGVGQWLIIAGRFDITYAVCSLSRYSVAPREGHLKLAKQIFGYLRKYPKRGYVVNPNPPQIDPCYENVELKQDFGGQYHYFKEEIDPQRFLGFQNWSLKIPKFAVTKLLARCRALCKEFWERI